VSGEAAYVYFCSEKVISITYSECACVALVMQHSRLIRSIMLSSVACPAALHFFFALSRKVHDFREKVTAHKICVLFSLQFQS
jgi:hypothetical protein